MFWFYGWTVYLMKGVSNMAIKKYIGARYAPKFMGAWDKTSEYAALSVVYTNDQSYVSRKTVPANTEITNTEFWIKSADWNAQVAEYNQNVERYEKEVLKYADTVNNIVGKTVYTYNTKDDMSADKRVKLNDTLMTCGYAEVNDKKGSFYKAVATTSAKAIALQNDLYAEPFELYPKDAALTGATSIDDLYNAEEDIGTSINKYFENGNATLFINDTSYTFNVGIIMKPNTQIIKIGKGTLTFNGNGAGITVDNYCKVSGVILNGNDTNTGVQENGYVSLIENCIFQHFNIGIVINNVSIVINKCYIQYCKTFGVNFTQKTPGTYSESTCVDFKDCTWQSCAIGVNSEAVSGIPTVVSVTFKMCVFEVNTKALNLARNFNTLLDSCWLEGNTEASTADANSLTIINLYTHPADPGITLTFDSPYTDCTIIRPGEIRCKQYTLWPANNLNDQHTLAYNNGLTLDGKQITHNIAVCEIDGAGSIVRKSGFPNGCTINIEINENSVKTIKFNGYFDGCTQVTSANAQSQDTGVFITQAVNIRMANDDGTRNQYGAFDTIAVKTFNDGTPESAFTEILIYYTGFTKYN